MERHPEFADASLFDALPQYGVQDELLSVAPVPININSTVENPVAGVYLDLPLPHMTQIFDYEIPPRFADLAVGARVKVTLGKRKIDGFVVRRTASTQATGKLRPIAAVVSNLPVLQDEIRQLLEKISRAYLCPIADLFRLAIPQRHARAEKEFFELGVPQKLNLALNNSFQVPAEYPDGTNFVHGELAQLSPLTLFHCLPAHDLEPFVKIIQTALLQGGSVLLIVPTAREVAHFSTKLKQIFPYLTVGQWTSEKNHALRYTQFLSALSGRTRIIVGTRTAIWAPLQNLQLILQFDDTHRAFQERRSPYIHAREVLELRAQITKAKFCLISYGPSVPGFALTEKVQNTNSPKIITPSLVARKHLVPQLFGANQFQYETAAWSRMPSSLFAVIREGLTRGTVLLLVPQAGYIPKLACAHCGAAVRCPQCEAALQISAPNAAPECMRCAARVPDFQCPQCKTKKLKMRQIGSHRTAYEIGRAFPGVPINLAGNLCEEIDFKTGQIVIATLGSVPIAPDGYAAAVVLDCGYLLAANSIEAEAQFLRAIAKTMRLVRSRDAAGKVLLVGDVPNELINVLGRWDFPQWQAQNFSERAALGLPPAQIWFEALGIAADLRYFLGVLQRELAQEPVFATHFREDLPAVQNIEFGSLNDPLVTGGVHTILPRAAILGPRKAPAGKLRIFLHPESEVFPQYLAALDRTNRFISIHRTAPSFRIRRNPSL